MGKIQNFFVEYDNENAVYYSGQQVNGRVVIELNESMNMQNLRLQLRGQTNTHWIEFPNQRPAGQAGVGTVHHFDQEPYLNSDITLFPAPGQPISESSTLAAGTHEFKFNFELPLNCPTSFEGMFGHVRYYTKAVLGIPSEFDHMTKAPFTTIGSVDLNLNPTAATPFSTTSNKKLGTCCKAGQVNCDVILARQGYVPGEKVALKVRVNNESSRLIKGVTAKLVQSTTFLALPRGQGYHRTRWDPRQVALVELQDEVQAGQMKEHDFSQALIIPPVPPSWTTSKIIQIKYFLQVKVNSGGRSFHIDGGDHSIFAMGGGVPITIGSVPLRERFAAIQPTPHRSPSSKEGNLSPPYSDLYPDLPPPSYESCMFGQVSIKDDDDNEQTGGIMNFAPKYPVYGFSGTAES